jgi:DNA-binding MarR family transcriptional regulator
MQTELLALLSKPLFRRCTEVSGDMDEHLTTNEIEHQLGEQAEEIDRVMLELSWAARRHLSQELDQFGLTVPQYIALKSVSSYENGCTMRALAAATLQVSPTMTGIVDRLSDRGLVERRLDLNDRRAWRVLVTPAGAVLLKEIERQRMVQLTRVINALEQQERTDLLHLMKLYLKAIKAVTLIETRLYGRS